MVIASGIVTSRTSFSFGSATTSRLRRWMRRRNAADRQAAAAFLRAGAGRLRRRRRTRCAAAPRPWGFIVLGFERGTRAGRTGDKGILAEALLGFLLGAAFGFLVVAAPIFLVALARFRGLAFGPFCVLANLAIAFLLLGDLAFFGFAEPGVLERASARFLFFLGQRGQHQPGRPRWGGGCDRGRGHRRRHGLRLALCRYRLLRHDLVSDRRLGLGVADNAAFDLFDDDGLGAAVAETLAHNALLDAALQRQGLGRTDL
jgi:hypothetical protein